MEDEGQEQGRFETHSHLYHHYHHMTVDIVDVGAEHFHGQLQRGDDEQCGDLQLSNVQPRNGADITAPLLGQEMRCERSALTVPLLRQDPPAYSKASPSSPASSTLTTSTLLSPSLLPPYPRPSSPPPPYSPPPQPPYRRLLVVLTVVIMLLSSLTVGITWKHWELMSTIQSQGKKVDQASASPPPR